jgi:hypothetical protein
VCCGCSRRRERAWRKADREKHPAAGLWRSARDRARKRGVTFTITRADVLAVWPADNRCPVLGLELQRGKGIVHDNSPTLDRLNGAWGYEPGNIAVISHLANRAKNSLRATDLEQIARWMRSKGLD